MRVGIVGLGLIGASIGLACKRRQAAKEILGHDIRRTNAKTALERGAIDKSAPLARIAECDLVFIAVPPQAVVSCLESLEALRSDGLVATDCAGVKKKIAAWVAGRRSRRTWIVPGHPMAGTERQGPASADADMFSAKPWIFTPLEDTPEEVVQRLASAVRSLGARPVLMDADAHDEQAALLSHLPHFVAAALVLSMKGKKLSFPAGTSWSGATRVAGSNPELWSQISTINRVEILEALDGFGRSIAEAKAVLRKKDPKALRAYFASAARAKGSMRRR